MDEGSRPMLWLVGEYDYDNFSPHAIFSTEEDAKAYAAIVGADVDEMPIFGPGEMPRIVEAWTATATVIPKPFTTSSQHLGYRMVTTTYDNASPALRQHRFSVLGHVPEWAKQACAVANCEANAYGLYIRFQGSDKAAVLEACTRRYEAGLDAMGARR